MTYESDEKPSLDFSVLDRARIEDLEPGDTMEGESGNFIVESNGDGEYTININLPGNGSTIKIKGMEEVFAILENEGEID